MQKKFNLTIKNNVRIAAIWQKTKGKGAILLLHMMPKTKESWSDFSKKLNNAYISTLAIDLRGHGESQDGPNGYKNFSDAEHQLSREDVAAALIFLKEQGIAMEDIYIAGASIGANLALQAMSDLNIKKGILLSPGLNYHGIKTLGFAKKLKKSQSVYIISSKDDKNVPENDKMSQEIFNNAHIKNKLIKIFETSGHGTNILSAHPELMDELVEWLKVK